MKKIASLICVLVLFSCLTKVEVGQEISQEELTVFVNQEGYLPSSEKYFMVENYEGEYTIKNEDGSEVYSGNTKLWKDDDESTGMTLYIGDFSDFQENGKFSISLPNGSESFVFEISDTVFNNTRNTSLKSFYLQRASVELPEEFAGIHKRPAAYTKELKYHSSSPIKGAKDVSGGWYDAGDFGRYITPGAVTLGIMMMGYEQYPEKFDFDNNSIPESGNGVSDFLDEMRYELEWMLKMQYTEEGDFKGALPYMVNSKGYVWELPTSNSESQWIYDFSSISTSTFTAVMALGSRIFKDIDSEFSKKCLEAALLSWNWLENNGVYPVGGFQRPNDTHTGGYAYSASDNEIDDDDRTWAAVELFLTTGESRFHNFIKNNIKGDNLSGFRMDWVVTSGFSKIQYIMSDAENVDIDLQNELKAEYLEHCDITIENIANDGFRTTLLPEQYAWGSNGEVLLRGNNLLFAHLLTGDEKYSKGALYQLNYVLGLNGHNMSFVAGLGSVYPKKIHHAITGTNGIGESFPGLIAGGPNLHLDNDSTLPMYFNSTTPPALCYVDHIDSWASNENCILYNAPLIPLSAYFSN